MKRFPARHCCRCASACWSCRDASTGMRRRRRDSAPPSLRSSSTSHPFPAL